MYKKGIALIEWSVYIFIFLIIISITGTLTIKVYKTFFDVSNSLNYSSQNNIDSSFITIKSICTDKEIKSIDYNQNKIIIRYMDGSRKCTITTVQELNSNLAFVHYKDEKQFINNFYDTCNYLVSDIKNIKFYKKNKIIYMKIITNDNNEFIRCL